MRSAAGSTGTSTDAELGDHLVERAHAAIPMARDLVPRRGAPPGQSRLEPLGPGHDDIDGRFGRPCPSPAASATVAASRNGRSHAAARTSSPPAAASAVRTPPSGPSPGHRSAWTGRPKPARRSGSPPTNATGAHPPAAECPRDPFGHRHPGDLDQRLVGAHAPAAPAAEHHSGGHASGGGPCGSSWARNWAHRSASSCSPIAAAIAPSPASERRKPRLDGSDQRT